MASDGEEDAAAQRVDDVADERDDGDDGDDDDDDDEGDEGDDHDEDDDDGVGDGGVESAAVAPAELLAGGYAAALHALVDPFRTRLEEIQLRLRVCVCVCVFV